MAQTILGDIPSLIRTLEGKMVLLVCGNSFDRLDIAPQIGALNPVRFRDFSPNPVYEDVCKGVELFRRENCDAILAVGGGSAMDVAKCIKLFSGMDSSVNYLQQAYTDTGVLLAAIPTTAGTGSESTRHAVIYYRGEKQSISHASLVPDFACLIPSVLTELPLYQKKCTMLDALCQAIESWWSVNATVESVGCSRLAIEAIRDNWKPYIETGETADKILLAANLAGRAINITATTAAHAMSYKLTSLYGIPHGHAVAICLPEVWEAMAEEPHLQRFFSEFPVDLQWFRRLLGELGMEYPKSGDKARDLEILADSVNPVRLKNNPVPLDRDTLKAMYERIVQ